MQLNSKKCVSENILDEKQAMSRFLVLEFDCVMDDMRAPQKRSKSTSIANPSPSMESDRTTELKKYASNTFF